MTTVEYRYLLEGTKSFLKLNRGSQIVQHCESIKNSVFYMVHGGMVWHLTVFP